VLQVRVFIDRNWPILTILLIQLLLNAALYTGKRQIQWCFGLFVDVCAEGYLLAE